jgi:hypothetical protein
MGASNRGDLDNPIVSRLATPFSFCAVTHFSAEIYIFPGLKKASFVRVPGFRREAEDAGNSHANEFMPKRFSDQGFRGGRMLQGAAPTAPQSR